MFPHTTSLQWSERVIWICPPPPRRCVFSSPPYLHRERAGREGMHLMHKSLVGGRRRRRRTKGENGDQNFPTWKNFSFPPCVRVARLSHLNPILTFLWVPKDCVGIIAPYVEIVWLFWCSIVFLTCQPWLRPPPSKPTTYAPPSSSSWRRREGEIFWILILPPPSSLARAHPEFFHFCISYCRCAKLEWVRAWISMQMKSITKGGKGRCVRTKVWPAFCFFFYFIKQNAHSIPIFISLALENVGFLSATEP